MTYKFLTAFLFVLLALFLQIFLGDASGILISFALAALITSAFFVDFVELVVLVLFSVLVLNWQPVFSFELLAFSLLPFAVFFVRRKLPLEPWLVNVIAVVSAAIVFYAIFGIHVVLAAPQFFLWDIAGSLVSGALVFQGLKLGE